MKMFRKKDEGFTLVELMVVVLIIGILIAIAIPIYLNATAQAQLNSCFANQRTIEGAVQTYRATNSGTDPANVAALVTGAVLKTAPVCPAGAGGYSMDASLTVNSDKGGSGWNTGGGVVHHHY